LPIGIGLVAPSSDVLLRDSLQASMCEERQDARFSSYLQIFGGGNDVDG
jgi:hypothetical protein